MQRNSDREKIEFGDFQTPLDLARRVCDVVAASIENPAVVLEPTCGAGTFLVAAAERFPGATLIGVERNEEYAAIARDRLSQVAAPASISVADFFSHPWPAVLKGLREPLLILGNPPWVTNSALSSLGSSNLPEKANFRNQSGLDAITGKSNFDISEWMLLRVLEWLTPRKGAMAMLCKTAVARKLLLAAWKDDLPITEASIYRLDADLHFGAAVDACLLICRFSQAIGPKQCVVRHLDSGSEASETAFGYRGGQIVSNVAGYERWKHLAGTSSRRWRSGIKHDCTAVMELKVTEGGLVNGLGELVQIEPTYLFPMLKTSELATASMPKPSRWMLVPQRSVGEDTARIQHVAPRTWNYLQEHAGALDRRGSSIYKNRARFSVFGIGDYSFAPWKVAISGFYKKLNFRVIGPARDRPVVLDDLSYFLPCTEEHEAETIAALLNSSVAREFYESFIFWDAKRPITIDVLARLDLEALGRELGVMVPPVAERLLPLFDRPA